MLEMLLDKRVPPVISWTGYQLEFSIFDKTKCSVAQLQPKGSGNSADIYVSQEGSECNKVEQYSKR